MVQDPTVNYKHRPLLFTGHLLHTSRAHPALGVAPIKQMLGMVLITQVCRTYM